MGTTHSESWRPPPTRILSRHLHRHHHLSNSDTSRHRTPTQPPCLRRRPPARLPARAPTSPPAARGRRTPTCRSAVCPYMFFANDQRDKVREENPGIKFGEVGKILGEKWKGLNDKQKAPYEAKAAADKKRYEEEKAAYTAGGEDEDEEE